ncbi:MAG: hypothetical protein ACJAT6_000704 [Akkermansiaceae bacterium]|jgi:hypothetical protein|tara:strand:- start:2019 stop:2402 length:384 start_codon:yes stop_codon:yes gene_type:complete
MKKILPFLLSSLITLGGSVSAQQQEQPPGPPRGERPPRPGGRPGPDNQGQAQRGEEKGPGARRGGGRRGGGGGPRPENLGESEAELGSAGIAWYPILEDGLAEAKLSNKPIFFMAVASQCGGISGVF